MSSVPRLYRGEMGPILQQLDRIEEDSRKKSLEMEVRRLAYTLRKTVNEGRKIRDKIVEGSQNVADYFPGEADDEDAENVEAMLEEGAEERHVGDGSNKRRRKSSRPSLDASYTTEEDLQRFVKNLRASTALKAVSLTQGFIGMNGPGRDEVTFRFTPCVGGRVAGEHDVVIRKVQEEGSGGAGMAVADADLPIEGDPELLNRLEAEFLGEESFDLPGFLQCVHKHLRAYYSRREQLEALVAAYPNDISNAAGKDDYRQLSFRMRIQVQSEDDEEEDGRQEEMIMIFISVKYEPDSERPIVGSLKISGDLDEQDLDALLGQCQVFYKKSLVEAVRDAFLS